MSHQAVTAVMKHSRTTGTERLVLMVIATHADKETFSCFPSREELALAANMSERNLLRYLQAIAQTGELVMRQGNGRGNLTTYTLNLPGRKGDDMSSSFSKAERVTKKGDKPERVTEKADNMTTPFNEPERERVTEKEDNMASPFTGEKGDKSACAYKDIEPYRNLRVISPTDAAASGDDADAIDAEEISTTAETASEPKPEQTPADSEARESGAGKSRPRNARYDEFTARFQAVYGAPYLSKKADFVQFAELQKKCASTNWELTQERFKRAMENYFASELGAHTFADLCARFSTFFHAPLDRFGKSLRLGSEGIADGKRMHIDPNSLSKKTRSNAYAAQAFIEGGKKRD